MAKKVEVNNGWTDKIYYVSRLSTILMFVLIFFSECNPARIYIKMNKNISLLTTAFSYNRLVTNFKYELKDSVKLLFKSDFTSLMLGAALLLIGMIIICAAQCVSLGNLKLKRISNYISLTGSVLMGGGIFQIINTYIGYKKNIDGVEAISNALGEQFAVDSLPVSLYICIALAAVNLLASVLLIIAQPKPAKDMKCEMLVKYKLFLIFLPFALLSFVFAYLPLYGWRYAFFDYKAGETLSLDSFVGLKWFKSLVENEQTRDDIVQVLKNTLCMSGLGIATSWCAIAFAIFLSEIHTNWFRRIVQVLTTVPNFISWVLVYAIAFAIFSTDGFVNSFLDILNSSVSHDMDFLAENSNMYLKMLAWGMWKGIGWSAIIYIAGISGIDQQLYEAATVDGAGRFQKIWHITVPGLMPTYCVMLLLSVAGILSNGMDQYLVFSNANNQDILNVLDLYVYRLGIGSGKIPLSTVVGMLKTIVSVTLLFVANGISKLIRKESII